MEDSIDVLLVGESLGVGDAVCGCVVNGLPSTVDLWDSLSQTSFIDSSDFLCSLPLRLSSIPVILVELFRDLNDGPRRLPPSPWNIEPSLAPL